MMTGVFRWFGMNVKAQLDNVTVVKLKTPESGTCRLIEVLLHEKAPSVSVDPLSKDCACATVADRVNATKNRVPFIAVLPRWRDGFDDLDGVSATNPA
jgi:hypothetical protein